MRTLIKLLPLVFLTGTVLAEDKPKTTPPPPPKAEAVVREIHYDGQLSDVEARFGVDVDLEVTGRGEAEAPLFTGEVAVLTTKLPTNLRLVREGNQFRLLVAKEGRYRFKLDLVTKIGRKEPWNQVSFTGPEAAIASVSAQARGAGVDLQLLSGTTEESVTKDGVTRVRGFLGPSRLVSVRWQSKAEEVTRKALLTCDTSATVQVTPTVVKYVTNLRYEILQGAAPLLTVTLPAAQALTKLQGEGVRDWQVKPGGGQQTLTVEFVKPVEKSYALTLLSEQTVESAASAAQIVPPQPQEVERESGSMAVSAEDVLVETETAAGLRQMNATGGALAAYQFYARPFTLTLRLRRIEPVVNVADRVTARLEESRLLVTHALTLTVEKAGIYVLELVPQTGFVVADVRGDGIEDWKATGGKLTVNFNSRVLGNRRFDVQLEQALKMMPDKIEVGPLSVTGAARETAEIGAASTPGIQLKTVAEGLAALREISINSLSSRTDESLAYNAEQAEWKLVLTAERMAPRITADVFNLITIGDGLLGGSATIRYAIINQGVQEFRVKMPALWKNVEFTGPNIRRKELQGDTWIIGLQDKAWGGYTLVVTYDYQFDPHKATLPIGGVHPDGVERETGSVAITSAANLQLTTEPNGDNIRRVDETELADNDRAFVTRPVLMAYKYQGAAYGLSVDVTRFEELPVLDAAADHTQLTTVLTEDGQMLTQASFMVKNNDRQFQSFTLPEGADFWACYVAGEPAKPEKNGDKLLVPLPRRANRDEAFAVDIVYVQKIGSLKSVTPRNIALASPETDMQMTYAEWELYVPLTHRLAGFGGNMIVARGATYGLRDAWQAFLRFYRGLLVETDILIVVGTIVILALLVFLVVRAIRRGWRVPAAVVGVICLFLLFAAMLLPRLSSPRGRALRANNLRQMGVAAGMYAESNQGSVPWNRNDKAEEAEKKRKEQEARITASDSGQTEQSAEFHELLAPQGGSRRLTQRQQQPAVPPASGGASLGGGGGAGGRGGFALSDEEVTGARIIAMPRNIEPATQYPASRTTNVIYGPPDDMRTLNAAYPRGGTNMSYAMGEAATWQVMPADSTVAFDRSGGRGGNVLYNDGRLGLGSTAGGAILAPGAGAVAPMVAGIRPIRIDIPREGQRFVFTKVLNVGKEPLAVRALVMDNKVFKGVCGAVQALAFVAGLALLWWQLRQTTPSSLLVTIGLALVIGSVVSLLLATRLLGAAMIIGAPVLALAVVVVLVRKFWKRRRKTDGGGPTTNGGMPSEITPPVVAAIAVLLFALNNAQAQTPVPPGSAVSILSATYTGAVRAVDGADAGRVAQFEAVLDVESTEPNQTVRLFGRAVAVQEFSAPKGGGWFSSFGGVTDARLVREGRNVSVFLPKKGRATLRIKFLVKLTGDAAKRQIQFGIPPALTSHVAVTLDEPEAMVEVPTAVSLKSTTSGQQTLVEAVLGAGNSVDLTWTPRMKRAAEIATTVFCQNASLVTFGGGVVNVRSMLDYQVTQGELRQLQVNLPAGQRLMRVEGDGIRTWKLDGQTLGVELIKGVTASYRLTVETEKMQEAPPASVKVEIPHAADVKRETGLVGLKPSEEFSLAVESSRELQKAGVAEFVKAWSAEPDSEKPIRSDARSFPTTAYRFLKPEFALNVNVEPVQPQIEAVIHNAVRISAEQIGLRATVDYTIKQAGLFALRLALPTGYRVERVAGNNVSQWVEKEVKREVGAAKSESGRVLEVALKERTIGAYTLTVDLAQTLRELPPSVEVVGVQPLDAQKLSGFVSVSSEEGVQIKSESFDGLTEVPAATDGNVLAPHGAGLAFKLIPGEAGAAGPGWKLTVTTEKIESWVRAEVMNTISLTETLVSGRSLVRYEIQNAPTKEFRVRVPAAFKNVEVTGPDIRRKDNDEPSGVWRIELQNKVRGAYTLTVTWDQPWNVKDGSLELMGVEATGAERETGALAVVAPPRLRLEAKTVTPDLLKADARDLPDWAERTSETPVLIYRYLRPGYKLTLSAQRFEEAEVLQALADSVRLTTVVSEDGQRMTEMSLAMRNNARQYLEVMLPEGAQVWSAFVSGQAVRPSQRDGKLLLPMERSSGDATVSVELTYVGTGRFPRGRGAVGIVSPALDVPVKNARWELYLPPDYRYGDFEGSMKQEVVAAEAPVQSSVAQFGLSEYAQVEKDKKAALAVDVVSSLSNARSQLAEGNVSGAYQFYSRAKQRLDVSGAEAKEDLKRLEKDLRESQGRNLYQAQQSFVAQNAPGQILGAAAAQAQTAGQQPTVQMQLEQQAAEQQAIKLQQAQEVVVAKTLPLRVNLPRRGVHYSFSQVLQTEVGKPMTIRFVAANEGAISWPIRIGLGATGFLLLWLAVSGLLAHRQR